MTRRLARAGLLALAALVLYEAVTFGQVWLTSRRDEARQSQAIVVLGAAQYNGRPSAVLRARLDHAADLWLRHFAPVIVVTGGRRPGDRFTEASSSAAYLGRKGVPDASVLREVSGRSSWESLAAAARFLRARGIRDVILVSDPFHAARIKAMARELGLRGRSSPTRTSPIRGFTELREMLRETLAISIGRLIGFRRLARVRTVSG